MLFILATEEQQSEEESEALRVETNDCGSLLLRRFVFLIVEASAKREWLVMNRKGPWEGYRQQAKRLPDLVSFSWQKSRFLGTAQFLVFLSLGSDQF